MRRIGFDVLKGKSGERGNVMLLLALALPLMILPLVGLAIDATVCYLVQAKLSAAVDGASLGAGRLLGTTADPVEIAGEFLNANFQTGVAGFWGANTMVKTIIYTPGTTKTIFVDANVRVPLLFMRVIGKSYAVVAATATATRRDSRMMLVIDRSGSMSYVGTSGNSTITDVKSFAQGFVQKFTPGTDQVGLVVFDGSAVVGYPTVRPWDSTTTSVSTGGPDTSFLSTNGLSCCDMVYQIKAIDAANGTNMADGLWQAYIELQKSHMKSLATDGVDTRLNSIVLFTDGFPTAVSLDLNKTQYNGAVALKAGNTCTHKNDWAAGAKMRGWAAVNGDPPWTGGPTADGPNTVYWPRFLAAFDANTANWWMSNAGASYAAPSNALYPPSNTKLFAGCAGMPWGNTASSSAMADLDKIPLQDMWGNRMDTTNYTESEVLTSAGAIRTPNPIYNGTALTQTNEVAAYDWGLAIWNATYQAANNIRNDTNIVNRPGDVQNMAVAIYTIGYTGAAGVDQGLLRAIANDKSAASYNPNQPTGMFVPASDSTALANAFTIVASAILRLKY
ncbi:MAG: vWA domain-containing protein [Candidatus Solibacter sp.]